MSSSNFRRALLAALFASAALAARAQNVGVGTLTPSQKLDVVGGNVKISTAGNGLIFPDGSTQTTAATGTGFIQNQTAADQAGGFRVTGNGTLGGNAYVNGALGVALNGQDRPLITRGFDVFASGNYAGAGRWGLFMEPSTLTMGVPAAAGKNFQWATYYNNSTLAATLMTLTQAGNLGLGTATAPARLTVRGTANALPAASGTTQSAGHYARYQDNSNLVLDMGGYGSAGNWLQSTDQSNLGVNYPLLLNPNGGNVGIGTGSPTQRLEVAGGILAASANPISGQGAYLHWNRTGGEGETWLLNQKGGGTANAGIRFGKSDGSNNVTEFARFVDNGNFGIGTTNPACRLDVASGEVRLPGGGGGTTHFNFVGDGKNYIRGTTVMADGGGRVGIGTANPGVPLDVQGGNSIGGYSYGYLTSGGSVGTYFGNPSDVSIRASGIVVAREFNAVSDRRLKTVLGRSEGRTDLALLNKLHITDYTMKDRAQHGDARFKKVIAQEVEEVFPQAVHQMTGFLPDVYAPAAALAALPGDSLVTLALPAPGLPVGAAAGRRLKLVGEAGEVLAALARPAAAGARTVVLRRAQALAGGPAFVFGLEHADVRAVDYEALAMLNVSATQELARQLAELKARHAALQAQAAALEARTTQAEADHASLLTLQAQMARLLGEGAQAAK